MKRTIVTTLALTAICFSALAQTKPAPKPAPKPATTSTKTTTTAKPATTATTAKPAPKPFELKNGLDSLSYAIGILDATFFKQQGIDTLNYEAMKQAVFAVIEGTGTLKMDPNMADQILRQKLQEAATKKIQPTIDEGEKFLAENKKRKEVTTTESGLQYEVVTPGNGPMPKDTNTVKVHYTGSLISGKVFDSSRERGEPIEFPLNGVIRGWTEGVQLMPVGSRYKFYIPYQLAYGTQGSPPVIPGGSMLIFDVELLEIVK
jgi:FKBP-type peptidyl-prolyl cis-trans isomerase FklB